MSDLKSLSNDTAVGSNSAQFIVPNPPSVGQGEVTISGSGFGSKSIAAPVYFNDFESHAEGANFDEANMYQFPQSFGGVDVRVRTDRAFSGTRAIRADWYDEAGMFPKVGVYWPDRPSDEMYVSYRTYHTVTVPFDKDYQHKWARGGCSIDQNGNFVPYSGLPRFYENYIALNKDTGKIWPINRGFKPDQGTEYTPNTGNNSVPHHDGWNHMEHYFKFSKGDGTLDGRCTHSANLVANDDYKNVETRLPKYSDRKCDFVMLFTGIPSVHGRSQQWVDHIYIDDTHQRVELGNNSTYTACTERIAQPAIAWSNTEITFNLHPGILISGTVYAYVLDNNGDPVSNNGQAITIT